MTTTETTRAVDPAGRVESTGPVEPTDHAKSPVFDQRTLRALASALLALAPALLAFGALAFVATHPIALLFLAIPVALGLAFGALLGFGETAAALAASR
ncbi:MAG: hypothetical protein ABEJ88_05145 [Halobacterium sp.]